MSADHLGDGTFKTAPTHFLQVPFFGVFSSLQVFHSVVHDLLA